MNNKTIVEGDTICVGHITEIDLMGVTLNHYPESPDDILIVEDEDGAVYHILYSNIVISKGQR